MGLFSVVRPLEQGGPVRFKNNRLSAVLRADHPTCMREMVKSSLLASVKHCSHYSLLASSLVSTVDCPGQSTSPCHCHERIERCELTFKTCALQVLHQTDHNKPAWDELPWAVRTGGKAFEKTHNGLSEFEWLKLDPKEEDKFSKAMKQVDSMGAALFTLGRHFLEIDQIRAQAQQDFLRSCHTLVPECVEYHLMAGRLDRVKSEWRTSFGLSLASIWLTMKCVQGR